MPGIFGLIRKAGGGREANEALINGMAARLSHNELYQLQTHADNWFALGNIGLPVAGEERFRIDNIRQVACAFSGFIYGWKGVDSDLARPTSGKASRIIDIYKKHGAALPEKVDGSFNIALFDIESREGFLCNEKLGHRHLYYFEDENVFLFSSEIKAFLAYENFDRELDWDAAADYFNYGYILGDKTMFKRVRLLKGGHTVQIKNGKACFNRYWDYRFGELSRQSLPELIEEVDSIYKDVIRRQTVGAKNVVIPLSGGLDSRFITGHAVAAGIEPHSFTHGRRGCSDHKIALDVVKTLNIKNYRFVEIDPMWLTDYAERFTFLSEGMIESSPAILLGISAQYGLPPLETVFLNGIFGGQTNFGASYFNPADAVGNLPMDERVRRIARFVGSEPSDQFYAIFASELATRFRKRFGPSIAEQLEELAPVSDLFCHQMDAFIIKNRLVRFIDHVDCNRFIWHDHFALADDRLNDFFIKLPHEMKPSRLFLKEYLKAKFPALARIPYQATGVDLYSTPSKFRSDWKKRVKRYKYLAERASRGRLRFYDPDAYTHHDQWYRAHRKIRDFYEGILLDDRTLRRGYFERPHLERLLKREREGGDAFYPICYLATFELFNRIFIDSK
jgi:asparagine synthase (glutamine-hydrolysing)